MVARAYTVAFDGVEARMVEVQCAVAAGLPYFGIVGLPDKAVSEAKERVRAALASMAIALPSRRIVVNLSPADLPKEGSHFDLPIALALLAALEVIPKDMVEETVALGELSLDGKLVPVIGALPAAMAAAEENRVLLCPKACGAEAAWVGATRVLAASTLDEVLRHYTGASPMTPATAGEVVAPPKPRSARCKGARMRQTGARNCSGGAASYAAGGQPWVWQIYAGRAIAVDHAASLAD